MAELVVHLSGRAYNALEPGYVDGGDDLDEDDDELFESAAERKKFVKARDKAAANWIEIGEKLSDELETFGCDVELPESPWQDLGCEGALRWTRLCDKKWNDEKREFDPLGEGCEIVVEEDTRVVFM